MKSWGMVAIVGICAFAILTLLWFADPNGWSLAVFGIIGLCVSVPLLNWAASGRHSDGTYAPRWQSFVWILVVGGVAVYLLAFQVDTIVTLATTALDVNEPMALAISASCIALSFFEFATYLS